ncbi:hypothetical protein OWR28_08790 [Chryseobacterium sp. 1B4]
MNGLEALPKGLRVFLSGIESDLKEFTLFRKQTIEVFIIIAASDEYMGKDYYKMGML